MTKLECDVVIVGGGPAGCSTAYPVATQGIEVIIVDKKKYTEIGDKVCGDALSPKYPQLVNELTGLPMPQPDFVENCPNLVFESAEGVDFRIPSWSGTIDRGKYGQQLIRTLDEFDNVTILSQTKLVGVEINQSQFVSGISVIQRDADGLREIDIEAKVTVDCSGTYSVVRKHLPTDLPVKFDRQTPKHNRYVSYREILETPEDHPYQESLMISNQPELEELGAAYYWIFSKGKRRVNVGLGYLITEKNRGKNIAKLNRQITDRFFPEAQILASQGAQIPARLPLPSCVYHGLVIVGDAAGLANPLNGEGHGPALLAGAHAAKTIMNSISTNDWSEGGLWNYNIYVWREFGSLFAWGIAVMRLMNKIGAEFIDTLVNNNIITQEDIEIMMTDTEGSISVWRILKDGWRYPRLLFRIFRIKRHADKIKRLAHRYPTSPDDNFDGWLSRIKKLEKY